MEERFTEGRRVWGLVRVRVVWVRVVAVQETDFALHKYIMRRQRSILIYMYSRRLPLTDTHIHISKLVRFRR